MSASIADPEKPRLVVGKYADREIIYCNGDVKTVRREILDDVVAQNWRHNFARNDFHWSDGTLRLTATNERVDGTPFIFHKKAKDLRKEAAETAHAQTRLTGHHSSHRAVVRRHKR